MSIIKILSIKNFIKKIIRTRKEMRLYLPFLWILVINNTIKFKIGKMNEIFK